jgi:hypothetical protein
MKFSILSIFVLLVAVVVSISMVDARRPVFEDRRRLSSYEADYGHGFQLRGKFRCCTYFSSKCCCNVNNKQQTVNGVAPPGADCKKCYYGWAC